MEEWDLRFMFLLSLKYRIETNHCILIIWFLKSKLNLVIQPIQVHKTLLNLQHYGSILRVCLPLVRMAIIKKQVSTDVGKELRGTLLLLVRLQTCTVTLKITVKNNEITKSRAALWLHFATLWRTPKGLINYYRDTWTVICSATLFAIARKWKQPKYPLTREQIIIT